MLDIDIQKSGLSKNIRLIGITNRIADILSIGDAFVAPYLHTMGVADYPLAIFEAMAMGKVVIAFDVGGISEILDEKRGISIELGDNASFIEKVVKTIYNKTESNKIGREASQFVMQNFSQKIIATKTLNLFEGLLQR
jgi:glycosyltransferase involved in cell wall biosynthesis